jgi:flagellar biosynthesis/type III secretory pathway ATPase
VHIQKGSNKDIDSAIDLHDRIIEFLMQPMFSKYEFEDILNEMQEVLSPLENEIGVEV